MIPVIVIKGFEMKRVVPDDDEIHLYLKVLDQANNKTFTKAGFISATAMRAAKNDEKQFKAEVVYRITRMLQELVADALVTTIKNWREYKEPVYQNLLLHPSMRILYPF